MADGEAPAAGIGVSTPRVDGRLKVVGQATYGSDFAPSEAAWAVLKTSRIGRGRIIAIDETAARAVPGVLDILTWKTVGDRIKPGKTFSDQGYMGSTMAPLASDQVLYNGQIVAVVVADSQEAAQEAADRLDIAYAEQTPSATFDSPGAETVAMKDVSKTHEDPQVGDAASAFASAPVRIDAQYATPTQHHNPIELFTTVCAWNDDRLTVWESSQNVWGFRYGLAEQLGIDGEKVRVISPYVGGAFGSRGALTQRTALIALAAQRVRRPVKLEATRQQGFTIGTYRAETRHHLKLGATTDGKLVSLSHEGWEATCRPDNYAVAGTDATTRIYACPNIWSKVSIVHVDRNTPGFMRAPPETPYLFALESAIDELAHELKLDPIELRRINDTQKEPIKGLPYTSRRLMDCFDAGARAFGWARRNPEPRSLREGDWLIGYGCATTLYPTQMGPASARVTLSPSGAAKVQVATHEIGNGVYTVVALTAAGALGLTLDKVKVEVGDSDLPPAPVAGGSNSTASVCTVVAKACEEIRDRIAQAAVSATDSPFHGHHAPSLKLQDGQLKGEGVAEPLDKAIGRTTHGALEVYAENTPHGVKPEAMAGLYRGKTSMAGGAKMKDRIQFAFGAQFVEVRVHARTCEVRTPRALGAFAAGKIVNPLTAKSQLMGGMIWGISAALHEATEIDRRQARYVNDDLAEYLIPVNADIGQIEVIMLPEQDHLINELGIKGVGELGNVGMNAAVANAVFNATGVRVRELPVRVEKLLGV
jgi:xanthine dehydrogenase YagR molybdenum-binding subunit